MSGEDMTQITINVDKLGEVIASKMSLKVKDNEKLWDSSQCSEYLGIKNVASFTQNVAALPTFPLPIELPSTRSRVRSGQNRWVASEVIAWALSHRRKKP